MAAGDLICWAGMEADGDKDGGRSSNLLLLAGLAEKEGTTGILSVTLNHVCGIFLLSAIAIF
jgi:hypothetical protein